MRGMKVLLGGSFVMTVLFSACTVSFEPSNPDHKWTCYDDDDCLEGFVCVNSDAGEAGICGVDTNDDTGCIDQDGDGYLAGAGCDPALLEIDCNDDPDNNGVRFSPGRDEECDAFDHNCDGNNSEDIQPRACRLSQGVCAGSTQRCIDDQWEDCALAGRYPPEYENVTNDEESCDGLDNNCDGEGDDGYCACIPGQDGPRAWGADLGICQRGIQFCQSDGSYTATVLTDLETNIIYDSEEFCYRPETECETDDDCGLDQICLEEQIDFREDFEDCCTLGADPGCTRSVCRSLRGETACTTGGTECSVDEICISDFCQPLAGTNEAETCDGVDNDCNGRIDDGNGQCAPCPYGMVQVFGVPGAGTNGICVDAYEASRPDASASDGGSVELYAANWPGVMPWTGVDADIADEACRGTAINELLPGAVQQRRLCIGAELETACEQVYPYGANFVGGSCNDLSTGEGVQPAGTFPSCCVSYPESKEICDLSGNVAEVVSTPFLGYFGGSAADNNAEALSCTQDGIVSTGDSTLDPSFIGFRCCVVPSVD